MEQTCNGDFYMNVLGRSKNIWLSPMGSALFTLQLHVPTDTILGRRISILQHLLSVAVVSAFKSLPGYEVPEYLYNCHFNLLVYLLTYYQQDIDLRLKWPNDIYAGGNVKIGGMIVATHVLSNLNICNVGEHYSIFNIDKVIFFKEIFILLHAYEISLVTYVAYVS